MKTLKNHWCSLLLLFFSLYYVITVFLFDELLLESFVAERYLLLTRTAGFLSFLLGLVLFFPVYRRAEPSDRRVGKAAVIAALFFFDCVAQMALIAEVRIVGSCFLLFFVGVLSAGIQTAVYPRLRRSAGVWRLCAAVVGIVLLSHLLPALMIFDRQEFIGLYMLGKFVSLGGTAILLHFISRERADAVDKPGEDA